MREQAWGRTTRTGYRNSHPFGKAFRRFLIAPAQFALLPPSVDWLQGGCWILADALVIWGSGHLKAGGVVRHLEGTQRAFLDHAFVHLIPPGASTPVLLDGDGLAGELPFIQKMERICRITGFEVRYQDCSDLAVGIPQDKRASGNIAARLASRFGRFDPRLLALI
jgi:hypothetical protein